LMPALFWPALARALSDWHPGWSRALAPSSLAAVGAMHLALASLACLAVVVLFRVVRRNGAAWGLTWDCGYAAPTARMQYTAGSFAGIITGWFQWVMRPHRHLHLPRGPFPGRAHAEEHTPETVLEVVLVPAAGGMMRVSTFIRRFQHGRLQSYILYLVLGLAALALIVVLGGNL